MPFKANAARRHRSSRTRYRVTNWRVYEAELRRRGGLTLWLDRDATTPMHLVLDSTGLELFGRGEWCAAKHGRARRRWLKLYIGVGVVHRSQIETAPPALPTSGSLYIPLAVGTTVEGGARARMAEEDRNRQLTPR